MKSDILDYPRDVTWVWLDLDDTLVDFKRNSRQALKELYYREGLDRFFSNQEEWITVYQQHNHSLWDRYNRAEITQDFLRVDRFLTPMQPRWTGSPADLEAFCRHLDPLYLDILAEQQGTVEGALELVEHLRTHGYNIGVLSNGFHGVQERKLEVNGLAKLVDCVVLSDDIGINKPDVRLYRYAMEQSGESAPWRHLMIGDNASTDIAGAVGAGWKAILLDPFAPTSTLSAGPDNTLVTPGLKILTLLKW